MLRASAFASCNRICELKHAHVLHYFANSITHITRHPCVTRWAVVAHPDWMLFGLEHADVRDELKRMALKGLVIFQSAGDISHISWNHKAIEEVVDVIAEG